MLFGWFMLLVTVVVVLSLLFPKLRYRVRDVRNAIDDKLSDPVKDHGHIIHDAKVKVTETREAMIEAIATNKNLKQKAEAANRDVAKYTRLAENAAKAQDADAVTRFVREKQRAEARSKTYLTQIDANDYIITGVKAQLQERGEQIENAEINKEMLEAQLAGTRLRQDMACAGKRLGSDNLQNLGGLQTHVDLEVARAEAYEEVFGKSEADLEEKYASEGDTLDDEVDNLLEKYAE